VQAAVQPGNVRSAGLLRSLGFQREGFSPRMLWLPGADGSNGWRDHSSYVLLRDEWPAPRYPAPRGRKVIALVNGVPGPGPAGGASGSGTVGGTPGADTRSMARHLAAELSIPLFSEDVVGPGGMLWALLADSPVGGVVVGSFRPDDARSVAEGLQRCGLDPAGVPEVWCFSSGVESSALPLGLGPTLALDTGHEVGRADVVRIALQVASGAIEQGQIEQGQAGAWWL